MIRSTTKYISARHKLIVLLGCLYSLSLFSVLSSPSTLEPESRARRAKANSQHSETLHSLRTRLAAHIAQPRFAPAAWGIKIVSLDTGKTIFEHNPQKYFNPASNAKLYTTALALEHLGADFRIKSSLYSTTRPDASGTLKGDLILYGRGDPTMAARLNGGDY